MCAIFINSSAYSYEYKSPLFDAVQNNDFHSVKKYINSGYAINIRDNYNNTPLTYAIQNNNYNMVALLLQNGANPLIVDSSDNYIYCIGKISNDENIRNLFKKYRDNLCSNINQIAKNNFSKNIKKTNDTFLSQLNWTTIGGVALTVGLVGGIAAAASGGGGGSDSSSSGNTGAGDGNLGGGEEEIPGEDIEYVDPNNSYLTKSQLDVYNNIISGINTEDAKYYSGYTYEVVKND